MEMSIDPHLWSMTFILLLLPIFGTAVPINRQVGISDNVFITTQNDTYGNEQRVCSIDSMTYGDGESIPTSSPCEHCICRPPGFACTIISCEYRSGCKAIKRSDQCCPEYRCECEKDGQIYQNGEKIMDSNNPCEVCYCQGGEIICAVIDCYWRSDCQPRYIENRCCPLYDHCSTPPEQGPIRVTRPSFTSTTTTGAPLFSWFNFSSAVYEPVSTIAPQRPVTSFIPITNSISTTSATKPALIDLSEERPEEPYSNPPSQHLSNTNSIEDDSVSPPVDSVPLPDADDVQVTNQVNKEDSLPAEDNTLAVHEEEVEPVIVPSPVETSASKLPSVTVIMAQPVPIAILTPTQPSKEEMPDDEKEKETPVVQLPKEPIVVPTEPEISEEIIAQHTTVHPAMSSVSSEEIVTAATTELPNPGSTPGAVSVVANEPASETLSLSTEVDGDSENASVSLSPTTVQPAVLAQQVENEPSSVMISEEEKEVASTVVNNVIPEVEVTTATPQVSEEMVHDGEQVHEVKIDDASDEDKIGTTVASVSEESLVPSKVEEISEVKIVEPVETTTVKVALVSTDEGQVPSADDMEQSKEDVPEMVKEVTPEVIKEEVPTTEVVPISSSEVNDESSDTKVEATTVGIVDEEPVHDDQKISVETEDVTLTPVSEQQVKEMDEDVTTTGPHVEHVSAGATGHIENPESISGEQNNVAALNHDEDEPIHLDAVEGEVTTMAPTDVVSQEYVEPENSFVNDEPIASNIEVTTGFPYQLNEEADEMYTKVHDEAPDESESEETTHVAVQEEATPSPVKAESVEHSDEDKVQMVVTDDPFILFDGDDAQVHTDPETAIKTEEEVTTQYPEVLHKVQEPVVQHDDNIVDVEETPVKHQVHEMGDGTIEIIPHYPDQKTADISVEAQVKGEHDTMVEVNEPVATKEGPLAIKTNDELEVVHDDDKNEVETTTSTTVDIVNDEAAQSDDVQPIEHDVDVVKHEYVNDEAVTTAQPLQSGEVEEPAQMVHDSHVVEETQTEVPANDDPHQIHHDDESVSVKTEDMTTEANLMDEPLDSKFRLDLSDIVEADEEVTETPLLDQASEELEQTTPASKSELRSDLNTGQSEVTTEPPTYQSDEQVHFDEVEATTSHDTQSKFRTDILGGDETTEVVLQDGTETPIGQLRSENLSVESEEQTQKTTTFLPPLERQLDDVTEPDIIPITTEITKDSPIKSVAPEASSIDLDDTVVIEVERHDLDSKEDFVEVSTQANSRFAEEYRDDATESADIVPESRSDLDLTTVDTILVERLDIDESENIGTTVKPVVVEVEARHEHLDTKDDITTISPDPSARSDLEVTTETDIVVEIQHDDANDEEVETTTHNAANHVSASDDDSVGNAAPSIDRLRKPNIEEMVIPEKGFPVIEPIAPEISDSKIENDLARFDLSESDSWLSRTFNRIKRLVDFFPLLSRQSRETKETKATSFKTKLRASLNAESKEKQKFVKVPTKRFLLF